MKTMFLLGAGASIKAGVPDGYEMSKKLLFQFSQDPRLQKYHRILSFIIGGLLFQKAKSGINPYNGVNVEEVFNAILLLADRQSLEVAPFIGSWDDTIASLDRSIPFNPNINKLNEEIYKSVTDTISKAFPSSSVSFSENKVDAALQKAVESIIKGKNPSSSALIGRSIHDYLNTTMKNWFDNMNRKRPNSSSSFGREFSRAIHANEEISSEGKVFEETAELMIINLINLVWVNQPDNVEYLSPIIDFSRNQKRLCIATLNYDNAIELLASSNSFHCSTGISSWSETGEFRMEEEGVFLLKLHGSIDWELIRNQRSDNKPIPQSIIKISNPKEVTLRYYRPAVIFGQRNKLTAEGPFLDLIRAFQKELSQTERLIIVGYSFRDPHINEFLIQWLNNSTERQITIVDPFISKNDSKFLLNLRNFLHPSRITIRKEKIEDILEELCKI